MPSLPSRIPYMADCATSGWLYQLASCSWCQPLVIHVRTVMKLPLQGVCFVRAYGGVVCVRMEVLCACTWS